MSGDIIDAQRVAAELLFREARLLDRGDWDQWVAMYQDDAVFWVPAWLNEYDVTEDPATQVSLLYHDTRRGLEDRISRIESRKSITALPLPRTVHQVTNVEATSTAPDEIACESVFAVYVYDPRTSKGHSRHGRCQHTLKRHDSEWKIARKIITLANDNVATVLDFYSI